MFSCLSLGLALLPFVSAVVHDIQVGAGGQLAYSPEAISAQPGDQVVFHFTSKNHTVSQSSFAAPCGLKDGGFDSGFMPVAANQTDNFPTYTVNVPDTNPIWVYCKQKTPVSHCGTGMVFAINCGADGSPNSFSGFKQSAIAFGAAQASATPSPASGGYGGGYGYGSGAAPPANTDAPATVPAAQTTVPDSSVPTTSTSGGPATHTVTVGGGTTGLEFVPSSIQAQPNDVVVFTFTQKNHTVTQSSFAAPCSPMNANGVTGFDSGFMAVSSSSPPLTWSLTVNDTSPIWAYCRQTTPVSHCLNGMVFAINAPVTGDRNFTAFENVAKSSSSSAADNTSSSSANGAMPLRFSGATVTAVAAAAAIALFF